MKTLKRLCAVLVGIVFLLGGLLKLMDPVGAGLQVKEYLSFFHLGFLHGGAKAIGILLSLTEGITGIALITGVRRRLTAWVTAVLVGFFTLVTLILWIANPAMHCGCFGEAIHLTHGETLIKNLILAVLTAFAFLPKVPEADVPVRKKAAFWMAAASLVITLWYNGRHLPLLDFTVYSPGVELYASLDNPYQAEDGLVTTYIYEKDGQTGSFTPEFMPDSTWTYVRTDTLERSGYHRPAVTPILSFSDADGRYQDELAVLGRVIVFSVYAPEKADWQRLLGQYETARRAGASTFVLVGSVPEEMDRLGVPPELTLYYADPKELMTFNRANGGGTYVNNGEIVTKWAPCDAPKSGEMEALIYRNPVDASTAFVSHRRILAQGFCLYLAALLLLL